MARFDQLQAHRDGVLALAEALRFDPGTGLLLYGATLRSMRWLLDAAGIPSGGVVGTLRVHGLLAVWGYALRAWERDEGADLPATMAAVDRGLDRAMQAEAMLPFNRAALPADTVLPDGPMPDGPAPGTPPELLSGPDVADSPDGPAML